MLDYGMNLQEQPSDQHERYGFQLLTPEQQDVLGTTYKALARDTRETVAVRLFDSAVDRDAGLTDTLEDYAYQFAQLNHTNVQRLLSFFSGEDGSILVGEYIPGIALDDYLRRHGVLDWQYAIRFLRQILRGLNYAHEAGFVHRSLAPQHLVVTHGNTIKITSFGLAHLVKQAGFLSEDEWKQSPLLNYAAPEAFSDEFLTPNEASDVYSVGLIAYEMLTGLSPVSDLAAAAEDPYTVREHITPHNLAPVHHINDAVPEELSAIVQKAMEHHAIHRYASAAAMLDALDEIEAAPLKQNVVYYKKSRFRPGRLPVSPAMVLICCGALALAGSAYFYIQSKSQNPFIALQTQSSTGARIYGNMPATATAAPIAAEPFAPADTSNSSNNNDALSGPDSTTASEILIAAPEMTEVPVPATDAPILAPWRTLPEDTGALLQTSPPESGPTREAATFQQAPALHTLTVRSRPTGATIKIEGREMGKTPFQLTNIPGPATRISLSLAGYRNLTRDITLDDDLQTDAFFNLTPVNRRVILSVFPWGNVYLDGDLVAERIAGTDTLMIAPTHQVLRVTHPSFGTWETPLDTVAPDSLNFTIDFRERASLSISAFDENQRTIEGAVFINGRDLNLVTPLTIELPLGNHLVEVRATGFEPIRISTTIDPNRGQPQPLNLQLKRK